MFLWNPRVSLPDRVPNAFELLQFFREPDGPRSVTGEEDLESNPMQLRQAWGLRGGPGRGQEGG